MATIVTRSGKGSPLTNNEVDANFTNLNTELGTKADTSSLATVATSGAYADLTGKPTLGTLSAQNADAVTITGGTLTGVTMDSITNHVGADHIHYKVKATEALAKGDVVKVTGFNSGEDAFDVAKVSASTDIAVGVIYSALANGEFGSIINTGLLEGIDTSAFAIGTTLYPNTTGGFTSTKPTTGRYQALAFVVRSHAVNGTILIEASEPQPTSLSQFTNDSGFTTNTGTVTSVDLTAGTGISVSGGPVTSSGAITVTNTAPDQVVSLTGAGTTVVTGTYPNFTVTSNDSATGTVTSVGGTGTVSGLTLTGSVTTSGNLTLGGTLALTSGDVTTALGFTPYNATNPSGFITSSALSPYLTSATAATTYQPLDGDLTAIAALAGTSGLVRKTAANTYTLDTATYLTGITSGDVTTALGFTPYNATNPSGYTTNVGTVTQVDGTGTVSGLTLTGSVTTSGSLTLGGTLSLTSGNVTTALGFTPYNATNPSGYLSSVSLTTNVTGTLPIANGGTGATTATDALTSLGAYPAANPSGYTSNTGTVTSVGGTGTVNGLTLTGSVTTSGNLTLGGTLSLTSGDVTTALGFTPYNATNPSGYITGSGSITGNAATATTATNLSTNRTNWSTNGTISAVVGQLAWKNYDNNHTIFDASNGTSPDGGAVNNTNAQVAWSGTYPTLMGWNGANTYGVRVDSARVADSAANVTGTVAVANGGTGVTSSTGTGNVVLSTSPALSKAVLNDGYTEEVFAITDGTVSLDPNNGSIQTWTLGDNRTPDQANWAAGQSITLMIDDGSAYTITWSTLNPVWETNGGSAPTLATSGYTVIVLWKVGTTIYGARVGDA